jgi:hemolysin activation/secretion protein
LSGVVGVVNNKYKLGKVSLMKNTVVCLLVSTFLVNIQSAIAAGDYVKPGAVRPQLNIKKPPKLEINKSINIPAVVDRPFGIDEGPKILVSTIHLTGQAMDRPKYDISVKAMQKLLQDELNAYPEGVTMGQMQEIADKLTSYYRERGLILAQAFVPSQKVSSDSVEIKVLEGRLGKVFAENNEYYSLNTLKRALASLVGEPVVKDEIESAVLELFDFPGLSVSAVFRPGEKEIGTTDIVLKVQEEIKFNLVANADNYGSQFSGVYRPRLDAILNNPTGNGDVLSASFMHAIDPGLTKFGAVNYQLPFFTPFSSHPITVGLSVSHEQFKVKGNLDGNDLTSLKLDGDTSTAGISFNYPLLKSRLGGVDAQIDLSRKRATSRRDRERQSRDDLAVLTAGINFERVDLLLGSERGAGNQGGIYLIQGFSDVLGSMERNSDESSRTGGSGKKAGGEFTKVVGNYTRLQNLGWGTSLLLRADGQWSDDLLVSLEQYSMGGPFNVRAYPQSESLVDAGYFGSAEFAVNAPGFTNVSAFWGYQWGDIIQFSTFVDYAAGYTNDPQNGVEKHRTLAGYGFGAKFTLPGILQMNMTTAFPLSKEDATNNHKPQTFFSVSVQY